MKIKPDDPKAHYNLAFVLERAGRVAEAISHLEQAVRLKPDFEAARTDLFRLKAIQITK